MSNVPKKIQSNLKEKKTIHTSMLLLKEVLQAQQQPQ